MPLRPARVGRVGVIGAPVAKTAVVAKAVSPGPSPVAKTAVVAAAVTLVGAVVTRVLPDLLADLGRRKPFGHGAILAQIVAARATQLTDLVLIG